jgi:large subunit ribosomal protein L23
MSKIGKDLKTQVILKSPRVTEKSTDLASRSTGPAYVFEVAREATKPMIVSSFETKYKVKPTKVNIVNLPAKKTIVRGVRGSKSAIKKAIVYLKPGEKIEIV